MGLVVQGNNGSTTTRLCHSQPCYYYTSTSYSFCSIIEISKWTACIRVSASNKNFSHNSRFDKHQSQEMSERLISLQRRKRRVVASRHQLAFVLACAASLSSVKGTPSFLAKSQKSLLKQVPGKPSQNIAGGSSVLVKEGNGEVRSGESATPPPTSVSQKLTGSERGVKKPPVAINSIGPWPCMDDLDRMLIKISLPVIATFAIQPIVSSTDLFFINRMGNALAVAGQSAANQVFGSVFWLTSFLPSITAILVSKEYAKGNKEGVQDAVCQALFVGLIFAAVGTSGLLIYPEKVLFAVLKSKFTSV